MDSKINPSLSAWLTRNGLGRLAWHADRDPATDPANTDAARVDLSMGVSLRAVATLTREPTERADVQFVLTMPFVTHNWNGHQKQSLAFASIGRVCMCLGEQTKETFASSCEYPGDSGIKSASRCLTDAATALADSLAHGGDFSALTDSDTLVRSFIDDWNTADEPSTPSPTYAEMVNKATQAIITGQLDVCAVAGCRDHESSAGPPFVMLTLTPEQEARLVALAYADAERATATINAARDAARAALTKALNIALAVKAPIPDYGDKPAAEVDDGPEPPSGPGYWDRRFVPSLTTAEPTMVPDDRRRKLAMHALNSDTLAWGGYKIAHDSIIGRMDGGDELVRVNVSTIVGEFEHHHPLETRVFVEGLSATADGALAKTKGRYIDPSSLVAEGDPDDMTARRASTMPRAQANHAEVLRYWRDRMDYDKDAADRFFDNHRDHVEHFNVRDLASAADYPTRTTERRTTLPVTQEPKP